jgi:DNA (cytosine-5)-methyltransferase 1
MAAIDLYSGIGGWTLGFKLAGIPVIASYEWWKDANLTHNKNFGSTHAITNIRTLLLEDLPKDKGVKFVVGSPPCTQFSLSNRGGKGDIKDGLVDIKKFLEVVEYIQPKYWAMENVPRVASILEKELAPGGALDRFLPLFDNIKVYNSSDFGVPQDRKRMIAGKFPFALLDSYAKTTTRVTLGDVLAALERPPYKDPIYGITLDEHSLTEQVLEPNLSLEEARINQESKMHHPVYNVMSFPDRQDRPSRTITALCTRVSRESIIIKDSKNNLRRLTVRERGVIQSFPISYQFFGSSYQGKLKMIGNAIPPLLTFYIAQSMLETPVGQVLKPTDVKDRLVLGEETAPSFTPDNEGATFSWSRSFWFAIKGLRFGSGVRFELKNKSDKEQETTDWAIHFHYGTSKNIKEKVLDLALLKKALRVGELEKDPFFVEQFRELRELVMAVDKKDLQENWTRAAAERTEEMSPIWLIDKLADATNHFKTLLREKGKSFQSAADLFVFEEFDDEGKNKTELKKLVKYSVNIFIGIIIGASFNTIMQGGTVEIKPRSKVRA